MCFWKVGQRNNDESMVARTSILFLDSKNKVGLNWAVKVDAWIYLVVEKEWKSAVWTSVVLV